MANTLGVRGVGGPAGPARATNKDVSEREDLANFITMITRDETPFMSSIGSAKATAIYHEWQTDKLEAPGNSTLGEGTDYIAPTSDGSGGTGATPATGAKFAVSGPNRTRLGNYTQINGKTIAVSGTRRAVDQAGVADEYAYQLKKRGTELRRDVEHDMIHSFNISNAVGSQNANARTSGGYQAFINDTATVNYLGGWSAPATQGDGTGKIKSAAANGNAPATGSLSLSEIDSVMQKIYEEGGKATKIMISPKLRRDFSDLMISDTGVVRNIDEKGKLRQSVDVYMSDFGDLMVVPNYIMGLTNNVRFTTSAGPGNNLAADTNVANFSALIYDPQWFAMASLRPLKEVDVGQKGDSTIGMMVEESTLEVRNPSGCGAIYGLA